MIANFKDLCAETQSAHETEASVRRRLYKDSECGIGFALVDGGIEVAGYAEGSDAECPNHRLTYPFTAEALWAAVKVADEEGCQMWEDWNNQNEHNEGEES
jgi:hypothetical protein